MKKRLYLLLPLCLCLVLSLAAGCKNNGTRISDDGGFERQTSAEPEVRKVDVDLTLLGSTMLYAEVNKMMTNPDDYIGKTVKANGFYAASFYEGSYYHFVLVDGVDACCPEGLMFIWSGEHSYPDEYPDEGTNIEIVGTFDSYEGFDFPYYCFEDADVVIVE